MKIVHISDTHLRQFPELEPGDVLIHSGDALNYGTFAELIEFRKQLEKIKDNYTHIIYVPGNHDRILEEDPKTCIYFLKEKINNLSVLIHDKLEINEVKFFGTAFQPFFFDWAFNIEDNLDLLEKYEQIPEDTEVLITHCPALGILDQTPRLNKAGSKALIRVLSNFKNLKAHLFGHIHYSYGIERINDVVYSNAALCGENYLIINKENVIEI